MTMDDEPVGPDSFGGDDSESHYAAGAAMAELRKQVAYGTMTAEERAAGLSRLRDHDRQADELPDWEDALRHTAAMLGYERASSPDFGEVDFVDLAALARSLSARTADAARLREIAASMTAIAEALAPRAEVLALDAEALIEIAWRLAGGA